MNYYGSCAGAGIIGRRRIGRQFDRVIAALHRASPPSLPGTWGLGMHYPARLDPIFKDFMTLPDMYHYRVQHFTSTNGRSPSPAPTHDHLRAASGEEVDLRLRYA